MNNTKQTQKGGDNSQNIQVAGNLVHNNIAFYSIEEIAKQLLNTSFGELSEETKKQIEINQKTYFAVLSEELSKIGKQTEELRKIVDSPDFAYNIKIAALSASKSDSPQLHKNLASLIVQRINNDGEDLKKIVYNEAIATIPKLTIDQLKIVTLCFLLRYTKNKDISSLEEFNNYLNHTVKPFLGFRNTSSQFEHVQYAACGNISIGGWNYISRLKDNYIFVFSNLISKEEINSLNINDDLKNIIFSYVVKEDGFRMLLNKGELMKLLDNQPIEQGQKSKIFSIYGLNVMSDTETKSNIEKTAQGKELLNIIEKSPIQNMSLTSVGKAIALTYFEQVTGNSPNADIWIN